MSKLFLLQLETADVNEKLNSKDDSDVNETKVETAQILKRV